MDSILGMVHGTYAYLLIVQILVVSLLFLVLLRLIMKRILQGPQLEIPGSESVSPYLDEKATALKEPTNLAQSAISAEVNNPSNSVAQGAELEKVIKLSEENQNLSEKVKFLESKLLEYEILQEEIGALGTLKTENEKLKQKLVSLESASGPSLKSDEIKVVAEEVAEKFDGKIIFTPEPPTNIEPAVPGTALPSAKQAELDDLLNQIESVTKDKTTT